MIKNLLKRFLPLPARTTNRRFDETAEMLRAISERLSTLEERQDDIRRTLLETRQSLLDTQNTAVHTHDMLLDARTTEINTERRLIGSSEDIIGLIEILEDDLERFAGMWQADAVERRDTMEGYYLLSHITRLQKLFPMAALSDAGSMSYTRLGREGDGGYVMLDDFAGRRIAYSFGIADDVSWDSEMAKRGLDVWMYDHTIDGLPEEDPRFHWKKTGLTGKYDSAHPELKTLPMLLAENGHEDERGMILKIDIEGAEWEAIAELDDGFFAAFSQIACELHDLNDLKKEDLIASCLEKLNRTHAPVHIHGNNHSRYSMFAGRVMPDVLECTYLNKSEYDLKKSDEFFPGPLDMLNYERRPEIMLGRWG